MKRGGEEIYVGPLGRHSCHLISYFEVRQQDSHAKNLLLCMIQLNCMIQLSFLHCVHQGVNGVSKIKEGYNPATWMLEVTTQAQEDILGVNFSEIYKNSELYQ